MSELLDLLNPEAVVLEPRSTFDKCIIGVTTDGNAVYDESLIIKSFVHDMETIDEAYEFYEYNTVRALEYVPKETRPIIIRTA